jgi:hypothetical protein
MTTADVDLSTWLLEQIAEDEADAKDSLPGPWRVTEWPSAQASGRWVVTSRYDPKFVAEFLDYGDDRRMAHHVARHDPTRVLAECDAKRRIIERHQPVKQWFGHEPNRRVIGVVCSTCIVADEPAQDCYHVEADWPCVEIRDLAAVFADHPGYREEWRP